MTYDPATAAADHDDALAPIRAAQDDRDQCHTTLIDLAQTLASAPTSERESLIEQIEQCGTQLNNLEDYLTQEGHL